MYDEYRVEEKYQGRYRSRFYADGREEQVRLSEPEESLTGIEDAFLEKKRYTKHVQAFVNNISAPKSLDEMIYLVENTDRFTVEELLFNDEYTEWTAPRWAKTGDIVFFMHTKTANSSLTAIRTELNQRKKQFTNSDYNVYMDWIERGLHLHKQYGGKIFAIAKVCGPTEYEDSFSEDPYHWRSKIYAKMNGLTILENPVDISEFRDFLLISRASGITPVFGQIFNKLKELIAKKNELPYYVEYTDATPLPLSKINEENWMKLSNEYRRAFMLESQFRHYYVDYLLQAVADRKKLFSECRCKKAGMADSFADNVIYIKGKYLTVEVKLSVPSQANIKAQARKYCYDDKVILDSKNRTAGPDEFHPGRCLIIDTDTVFMYNYDMDEISSIFDLDNVLSIVQAKKLKNKIEAAL